jgi:hypothetical protein
MNHYDGKKTQRTYLGGLGVSEAGWAGGPQSNSNNSKGLVAGE